MTAIKFNIYLFLIDTYNDDNLLPLLFTFQLEVITMFITDCASLVHVKFYPLLIFPYHFNQPNCRILTLVCLLGCLHTFKLLFLTVQCTHRSTKFNLKNHKSNHLCFKYYIYAVASWDSSTHVNFPIELIIENQFLSTSILTSVDHINPGLFGVLYLFWKIKKIKNQNELMHYIINSIYRKKIFTAADIQIIDEA